MKNRNLFAATLLIALSVSSAVQAHESGTWLVRSRAIYIDPVPTTTTLDIGVKTQATPEFDFSYFVAKNVALELILGMARHNVSLNGAPLGSVNVLPPTLNAQYHFQDLLNMGGINPYLGAGLNYTLFFNETMPVDIEGSSFGPSLQAGIDIPVTSDVFVNLDIKKIWMQADVLAAGTATVLDTLKINPWVYGIGIGFKL